MSVLNAEPFQKEIRSQRCFKCQCYSNHNAKFCRNETKCGWCAQPGHSITECTASHNISLKACAPCGGQRGHCALDAHCPARIHNNEQSKIAYIARPSKFKLPALTPSAKSSQPRPSADSDDDSFILVNSKRRRGQPTGLSKANTACIPNIASFPYGPSISFSCPSNQNSTLAPGSLQTPSAPRDEDMPDPTPHA